MGTADPKFPINEANFRSGYCFKNVKFAGIVNDEDLLARAGKENFIPVKIGLADTVQWS